MLTQKRPRPRVCPWPRADFETVLAALEDDAEARAREDAQDVLQSRAPRRWLQELDDAEDAHRDAER